MLMTEISTAKIPDIYQKFARVIDERHWKKRVVALKQEMKGNRFLHRYIHAENAVVFQLEHLRELHVKHRVIPPWEAANEAIYPAASFAAQVLSIMDASSAVQAEQLKRRVHGAIKNPDDMRALRLELSAATHFTRRGYRVSWPEMNGQGTFDLFVEDLGPNGLEIECKSISENKGRKIHQREALEFFTVLWPHLKLVRDSLRTGISVVLTMPGRLPASYKDRVTLAKRLAAQIIEGRGATLEDGVDIRITDFALARLGNIPSAKDPEQVRAAIDDVTSTRNREVMVIGTHVGGALALALQSAKDDSLLRAVFDTLSDSAKRQLTGKRPAIFLASFDGLDGDQLLSIASQDNNSGLAPTSLRIAVSKFLSGEGREHVVGVGFLSRSGAIPATDGVTDTGGTAYYFPKPESPLWDNSYSGLFEPDHTSSTYPENSTRPKE